MRNQRHPTVTRVEVIDSSGRAYVAYEQCNVVIDIQDGGRTLKVFTRNQPKDTDED